MIPIKNLKDLTQQERDRLFNRFGDDFTAIMIDTVVPIVKDVQREGDEAVKRYTERFDRVKLGAVMADPAELEAGWQATPAAVRDAFAAARDNIVEFHARQKREDIRYERPDGAVLGVKHEPIESAAIYVPGGKASYPSSVLMGVIPAQIAGVRDITLVTPPDRDGRVPAPVGAMCRMLGVANVLKSGGAQGIAAAGFGTQTVPRSEIIVGPGNIYVTAAKTYLFSLGVVQIDSMAGPSEVLIVADGRANPRWVAWDLLSQAEHDEMAIAVLVTTSRELAEAVNAQVREDIESGRGRHAIKKTSVERSAVILVTETLDEAFVFANQYGPEHMEVMVENALDHLPKIRNVGSLFLGDYAPVAVGDYFSGTNHILPTGGAARFSSGTSVESFMRRTTFQYLTRASLERARGPVETMARVEGFDDKHGGSVAVRFEE